MEKGKTVKEVIRKKREKSDERKQIGLELDQRRVDSVRVFAAHYI
jgi:hypothetical protein